MTKAGVIAGEEEEDDVERYAGALDAASWHRRATLLAASMTTALGEAGERAAFTSAESDARLVECHEAASLPRPPPLRARTQ